MGVMASFGMRENCHSLAPSCSCQPFKSMVPSKAKTMMVGLSKTTLELLLQSLLIPRRLCWKEGMILAFWLGRLSWMLACAEERCLVPAALLTVILVAEGLTLMTGAAGMR